MPITIQAITGDQLAQLNITTFDDFIKIPAERDLRLDNGPGQGNIFMRGLARRLRRQPVRGHDRPLPERRGLPRRPVADQFPGRNLDVYVADMDRIEVLEGPQGTLFGGGAEAGVVRYITNKPKLDVTEGTSEGGYGIDRARRSEHERRPRCSTCR